MFKTAIHIAALITLFCQLRGGLEARLPDGRDVPIRVWTWDKPLGTAREMREIVQMIRIDVSGRTGSEAANSVCNAVLRRKLVAGEVCILLQNFALGGGDPSGPAYRVNGQTPLFLHPRDGLDRNQCKTWWLTPWMKHGIDDTRRWMLAFIAQYQKNRTTNPAIPRPSRFHFDSETQLNPHWKLATHMRAFDAMRSDERWATEKIPGWDMTLAELYEQGGSVSYDLTKNGYGTANAPWAKWYTGIVMQAIEGAMNVAAYEPIRETWPTCKSSNFGTSASVDGVAGRVIQSRRHPHLQYAHRSFADLAAPVFYVKPRARPDGDVIALADAEEQLEKFVNSFGGVSPRDITPWIELPGSRDRIATPENTLTPEFAHKVNQMLYANGVREFLLWNSVHAQTVENWNAFATSVRRLRAGTASN